MGFTTRTASNAAVIGVAPDTLKRLYKKDSSLDFMIEEGGNLISYPSSMEAWKFRYDEKKREERRAAVENYKGWVVAATDSSSGSAIGARALRDQSESPERAAPESARTASWKMK